METINLLLERRKGVLYFLVLWILLTFFTLSAFSVPVINFTTSTTSGDFSCSSCSDVFYPRYDNPNNYTNISGNVTYNYNVTNVSNYYNGSMINLTETDERYYTYNKQYYFYNVTSDYLIFIMNETSTNNLGLINRKITIPSNNTRVFRFINSNTNLTVLRRGVTKSVIYANISRANDSITDLRMYYKISINHNDSTSVNIANSSISERILNNSDPTKLNMYAYIPLDVNLSPSDNIEIDIIQFIVKNGSSATNEFIFTQNYTNASFMFNGEYQQTYLTAESDPVYLSTANTSLSYYPLNSNPNGYINVSNVTNLTGYAKYQFENNIFNGSGNIELHYPGTLRFTDSFKSTYITTFLGSMFFVMNGSSVYLYNTSGLVSDGLIALYNDNNSNMAYYKYDKIFYNGSNYKLNIDPYRVELVNNTKNVSLTQSHLVFNDTGYFFGISPYEYSYGDLSNVPMINNSRQILGVTGNVIALHQSSDDFPQGSIGVINEDLTKVGLFYIDDSLDGTGYFGTDITFSAYTPNTLWALKNIQILPAETYSWGQHVVCYLNDGELGHCETQPDSDGICDCIDNSPSEMMKSQQMSTKASVRKLFSGVN